MFSACAVHVGPLSGPLPRFHPHVVRHIPQLVTTFTSTHSIRDNLPWLDACPPKQSCHHRRPGRVFHPHMIRRLVQHVLRHTSIHYTLDKPARLNTRIQNKNTGVKKKGWVHSPGRPRHGALVPTLDRPTLVEMCPKISEHKSRNPLYTKELNIRTASPCSKFMQHCSLCASP